LSEDWVPVGRIGRAHGRDGSFVVEQASEDEARFAPGARVYVGREPATVVASKRAGGRLVVRLDRRAQRGSVLAVPRGELPAPEEGSYYVVDLEGLDVVEEGGRGLGRVQEVAAGVANDVLRLDSGVALPMVEDCIRAVDIEGRRIVVAQGFAEGD
jgi:16S rRNA processing protein RimM